MLELMREEIDFEEYMASGVIKSHFPLHKRKYIEKTIKTFDENYYKLKKGFINGKFHENM